MVTVSASVRDKESKEKNQEVIELYLQHVILAASRSSGPSRLLKPGNESCIRQSSQGS